MILSKTSVLDLTYRVDFGDFRNRQIGEFVSSFSQSVVYFRSHFLELTVLAPPRRHLGGPPKRPFREIFVRKLSDLYRKWNQIRGSGSFAGRRNRLDTWVLAHGFLSDLMISTIRLWVDPQNPLYNFDAVPTFMTFFCLKKKKVPTPWIPYTFFDSFSKIVKNYIGISRGWYLFLFRTKKITNAGAMLNLHESFLSILSSKV